MKKGIVIGLIIGILITSSVAFGADAIRNSYFNPDLKLAINGKPVQDLRIVTVELEGEQYGRNYYSIADLVKALNDFGGVVAKVDFDANTKTTVIDIEQKEIEIISTPEPTKPTETVESNNSMEGGENNTMEVTLNIYGLPDFINYKGVKPELAEDESFVFNGTKYIRFMKIRELLNDINCVFNTHTTIDGKKIFSFLKGTGDGSDPNVLIEEVPYSRYSNQQFYVTEDYYINTILPTYKGAE